jgi:hypothetical protein
MNQNLEVFDVLSSNTLDDASIVSKEIRRDYTDLTDEEFVPFALAAVILGKGSAARIKAAHFIILDADRRFLLAKEKDGYFVFNGVACKTVVALCVRLNTSRKHFYHLRNLGLQQKQLTAEEVSAKDVRLKLQEKRRDCSKKQKAEDRKNEIADAVKPLEEKLRIAEAAITAANAANVVRENSTDAQAVSAATTAAAQAKAPSKKQHLQIIKTKNASGDSIAEEKVVTETVYEVAEEKFNLTPQTARDIFYYNLGYQAANVRRTVGYVPSVPQDTDEASALQN